MQARRHNPSVRARMRALPDWIVMTDEARLADPAPLLGTLPPASMLIVRDRDAVRCLDRARALASSPRIGRTLVLAAIPRPPRGPAGLDGFHIPERALRFWTRTAIRRLGPGLLTAAAHDGRAIRRAWRTGADAVLLSPVLPTRSHPGQRALGLMRFAALARTSPLPVYALGGIAAADIRRVLAAGAAGIAGIGLFTGEGR